MAVIREDCEKRLSGTKKLLGFVEYRAPEPEFVIFGSGGKEFCRVETSTNWAKSRFCAIYRMAYGRVQYRLQEITGSSWPYKARWVIFCGERQVAVTSPLGWNGVQLQRVDLSLAFSEHLPPVVLLMLTWWSDLKSELDTRPGGDGGGP